MATRRHGRLAAGHVDDSDLHVDVMRFFAIVALCLFAILPHGEISIPSGEIPNNPNFPHGDERLILKAQEEHIRNHQLSTPTDRNSGYRATESNMALMQRIQNGESATSTTTLDTQQNLGSGEEKGGIRFLDVVTFSEAVKNGSIKLVYRYKDGSFVFDAQRASFETSRDMTLQVFELASSEIPDVFEFALRKVLKPKVVSGRWFITLPEETLINIQYTNKSDVVLDEWALPI